MKRVFLFILFAAPCVFGQNSQIPPPLQLLQPQGQSAAPVVLTLQDALDRAKTLDAQFLSAVADGRVASEDRAQAKSSMLPAFNESTQYLGTQGNGTLPTGRFVTNDGDHVYRAWAVMHQDLSANTLLLTGYKRAQAAEAVAKAKVETAQRGLEVTVTKNYYALVSAERKYATAQLAAQQSLRFWDVSQQQERFGQAAHSDAVKAELQYLQLKRAYDDATLAIESARLNLAVMLFSSLNENFTVVDDLDSARALPPFLEIQTMAEKENPDLRAADESLRQAGFDVRVARNALLPTLSVDADYGIEANAFALRSRVAANPEKGVLPNLGYFITANLTIPIWDWGTLKSKVTQTQIREKQAEVQLTQAQRQLAANLFLAYNEAVAARASVDGLRHAADLATESLRLTNLRYQAGESPAQEVVDAQTALVQARNAYDDAQSRYRIALSALQVITGSF